MNESSLASQFLLFILSLNVLQTNQNVIYIGTCPIVLGDICDSTYLKFYLYSRWHREVPEYVEYKEGIQDNLTESAFNSGLTNKIIIHGYSSSMHYNVLQNIKNEYLGTANANVWMVNYPDLVENPCYPFAVYNIKFVGKCIASFLKKLKSTTSSKLDVHVIGFSLGAQVANHIAQFYLPYKLPRITGLDPALPLFYSKVLNHRLDPSDAEFVDVLHTNALLQGQVFPCGHVDIYANGGVIQPGCSGEDRFNCYHARAADYFSESIITKVGFWGWRCSSFREFLENKCIVEEPLTLLGAYVDPRSHGIYSIHTAPESPFALGKNISELLNTKANYGLGNFMGFLNSTLPKAIAFINNTINENEIRDVRVV